MSDADIIKAQKKEIKKFKKQAKNAKKQALKDRIKELEGKKTKNKNTETSGNDKIIDLMIDHVIEPVSNLKGWKEYYDGKDEYGHIRSEKISQIDDGETRIKSTKKLVKRYKKALAKSGVSTPDSKIQKKIQKADKDFDEKFTELKNSPDISATELNSKWSALVAEEQHQMKKIAGKK